MPLSPRVPELGALDLLLSVARLGSLGRAAEAHGISQPAAGSRIKYLEGLLGLAVIERSPLGSRLTAEGAMIADWAREVISAASSLDEGVTALRSGRLGRVQVAASLTVADYLMPLWLCGLRARRPDATVSLQVVNSSQVCGLVLAGEVGLGFIESPNVETGLKSQVVGRDRLVLVVAPGHRWARRQRPVGARRLAETPLVQRERGSGTRETVESVLGGDSAMAPPIVELSSTTAIKSAVEAGVGPAVLSTLAVADELRRGVLCAVDVAEVNMCRQLRAVWAAGRRLGAESQDVLAVAIGPSPTVKPQTRGLGQVDGQRAPVRR
jgi:DNA-binding transcriptional LysR family regulator